jgi:class 3 adenylate cyclase/Ca2+-binding EF-hand superfamily protein
MDNHPLSERSKPLGRRRLAAIMFTDAVGSSRLMGDNEDHVMSLLERDIRIIDNLCQQFEGRVLKSMGDGCLAIFESGVHAVECAREIQRHFKEQSDSLSENEVLEHRIGIHLGDVYVSDDDAMGDGVNIAARLQSEAPNGGICISQALYEVVKTRLALKTVYQGPRQLKNIREEVHLYSIVELDESPSEAAASPYRAKTKSRSRNWFWRITGIAAAVIAVLFGLLALKSIRNTSSEEEQISAEFNRLDLNGDSRLTPNELPDQYREPLMKADVDQDGAISIQEFKRIINLTQQREELQQLMFYQLDTNDDDCISPDELPERLRDRLMPADQDQNGTISLTEFQDFLHQEQPDFLDEQPSATPVPDPPPPQLMNSEQIFQNLDTNHDNRITMDEIPLRGRTRMMRADLNGDGIITNSEFRAALNQFGELR